MPNIWSGMRQSMEKARRANEIINTTCTTTAFDSFWGLLQDTSGVVLANPVLLHCQKSNIGQKPIYSLTQASSELTYKKI